MKFNASNTSLTLVKLYWESLLEFIITSSINNSK